MRRDTAERSCAGNRRVLRGLQASLLALAAFLLGVGGGTAEASQRRNAVVVAVEKAGPAVVNISTTVRERIGSRFPFAGDDFFRDFFPELFSREYTRTSLGSGVIIDGKQGHIITNHHVVAGAAEIKVITSNSKEYLAKILGSDPRSDLALLQIKADEVLPSVEMGNSDDLMIGETVIAIGNPFGLSHTVTTGVISALDRSVSTEERVYQHLIQTDASINPGNSGGPLINIEGELIGINSAIYQKAQGIGFAIAINKASRIVKELLRVGEVRFPWLGLELQGLNEPLKRSFGLDRDQNGVLVSDLVKGSPAERGGVERGDILTALGGMVLTDLQDYRSVLAEFTPGDRLSVQVFRKGKVLTLTLQPSSFPLELARDLIYRRLGIRVGRPDEKRMKAYGLTDGIMISEVRPDSEAGKVGLEPGDLILKVNDLPVKTLNAFDSVVARFHHLASIILVVQRGRYAYSVTLPF